MGGRGAKVVQVAREIYDQWSVNHHFEMYDDVAPVLAELQQRGLIVGADLELAPQPRRVPRAFSLGGFITVSVSGAEHGYMKPHRSIFDAALERAGVTAAEALMVGDSFKHDIEGALSAGMARGAVAAVGRGAVRAAGRSAGDHHAAPTCWPCSDSEP